ncbi:RNA 2',3'-cyclic phosphodiesterase [Idiomarina xiamenensis]|uniref:RNA 2',3'-cyclic phosphodiesterase n=1 Tax=Idiomarina xiamenensis 10-D-4 TaxID=740709 RepID=K2KHI0_9GAMM|nr:RNA 2',3'-cyclic phosphodiesterase [Idiomarina xiamenensis]EKE87458.1 2'-5' RNA ligase [Idiomarina xiamenensis 10-D-4]
MQHRLFLGLDLLPHQKQQLATWQAQALAHPKAAVFSGNYHLTLAFFGERDDSELTDIVQHCQELVKPALHSHFGLLGYWSESETVYLAPSQPNRQLNDFANRLRALFELSDRHPFSPHISLIRGAKKPATLVAEPANFTLQWQALTLFRSRSTNAGVRYQALARWPLPTPARLTP